MLTNDDPDRLDLIEAELDAWSDVPWTRVTVAWLVGELRAERTRTRLLYEALKDLYDLAGAYLTPERLAEEKDSMDAAFVAISVHDLDVKP